MEKSAPSRHARVNGGVEAESRLPARRRRSRAAARAQPLTDAQLVGVLNAVPARELCGSTRCCHAIFVNVSPLHDVHGGARVALLT
jgi:hypothetical protein